MNEENPYLASQILTTSSISSDTEPESYEFADQPKYLYAGFFKRAIAKAIDIAFFGFVFLFLITIFSTIKAEVVPAGAVENNLNPQPHKESQIEPFDDSRYRFSTEPAPDWLESQYNDQPGLSDTKRNIIITSSFIIFVSLMEWFSGQTLGKALLGLQVVCDGQPTLPTMGRTLGRNAGLIFDGMFFGLFALVVMRSNFRQQRAGDLGAHTLVVLKKSIEGPALSTPANQLRGYLSGALCILVTSMLLVLLDSIL